MLIDVVESLYRLISVTFHTFFSFLFIGYDILNILDIFYYCTVVPSRDGRTPQTRTPWSWENYQTTNTLTFSGEIFLTQDCHHYVNSLCIKYTCSRFAYLIKVQSVLPVQLGDQRQSERGKKRKTGALAVRAQSRFERL